ncbi:hypothetical protein RSOLAG22IIIB_08598 [Rhizoctonia solani]|uniref:Protein kinase domain-containing protein n=1 Tax=Rhizoctonia solani TaxID=456999 RepID=A0A0K6FTL7_9AGAM|nr:hypothetical protein RSOLAG22IIIB_08598 [Rhizoctonia solani]
MNHFKQQVREVKLGTGRVFLEPDGSNERETINTISGAMPTHQILGLLRTHDCKDVTRQLDLSKCSQFPISTGGFGDVFKGQLQDGNLVAIKCLRLIVGVDDKEGQRQLRRAAHEIYVWSKCKHPNVLELIGVAQYRDRIAMVSPWMEKGSLTWFLSQNPTVDKYEMCAQVAEGVAHMHASGIVHGDIKGSNILVSHDHVPKLADFGTSFLSMSQYTLQFTRGTGSGMNSTVRYTAPEILKEETKLTTEGDIYALGMTILEAITGRVPYEGSLEVAVIQKAISGIHPARPEQHIPTNNKQADAVWDLLKECWASDPGRRPSAPMAVDRLKTIVRRQQYATSGGTFTGLTISQKPAKRTPITLRKPKNKRLTSDKAQSSVDSLTVEVSSEVSNDEGKLGVSADFGTNEQKQEHKQEQEPSIVSGFSFAEEIHKQPKHRFEPLHYGEIPDISDEVQGEPPSQSMISLPLEHDRALQPPPVWQRVHQRLLAWAMVWSMAELDKALVSTERGHQVEEIALSVWSTQVYKRYVRARMSEAGRSASSVDRMYVPPNMADAISTAVYNGQHGDACQMLKDMWAPFGLEGMPRLIIVLARHRRDEHHWVTHRFSLPDGQLSTYDTYPDRSLPDGRPLGWWFAIRSAWPHASYPPADALVQKMVRINRPLQLSTDCSVAAAAIWRNLIMGSKAQRIVDLDRLRDLISTEVKSLKNRKQMGRLTISNLPQELFADQVDADSSRKRRI